MRVKVEKPAGTVDDLWGAFSQDLHRYIVRRVRRPEDADDILQTVFLRIHTKISTLQDEDRLLGWMYALTRNAITDYYRLASNRRETTPDEMPERSDHDIGSEDENIAEAELSRCLRPMIARLPPEQAAALELVEFGDLSQVKAAALVGVSVSGMKSRVQRGRARLREMLLDCCAVGQDVRGRVQEFTPRSGDDCSPC